MLSDVQWAVTVNFEIIIIRLLIYNPALNLESNTRACHNLYDSVPVWKPRIPLVRADPIHYTAAELSNTRLNVLQKPTTNSCRHQLNPKLVLQSLLARKLSAFAGLLSE